MLKIIKNTDKIIYFILSVLFFTWVLFIDDGLYFVKKVSTISFFLISSIYFSKKNKKPFYFVIAGLFTLISDTFLVDIDNRTETTQIIAMISFNIVQIMYMILINKFESKYKMFNMLRLILSILLVIVSAIVLNDSFSLLIGISGIYIVNLIINVITSINNRLNLKLLWIGLLSFLCCDIYTLITYAMETHILGLDTNNIFFRIMYKFDVIWFFYIIAQFIIVLSINYYDNKEINNIN